MLWGPKENEEPNDDRGRLLLPVRRVGIDNGPCAGVEFIVNDDDSERTISL